MPKITILPEQVSAEVQNGELLFQAGEKAGVEMEAGCFHCSCGTCAVEIVSGIKNLEPPTDDELDVLDGWSRDPDKYRLSCCTRIRSGEVVIRKLK
jgi:ferredoxin